MNQDRIRRWCLAAIKLLILAVVFWFVHQTILDGLAALGKNPLTIRPAWLLLSGALYLVGLLPAAVFWRRLLRTLGQDARPIETLRAYYIGHLGKYVPGKAMVVVLRAGLIRGGRVDTTVAAVTVFYETLMMMSVGAFWAAAVLMLRFRDHPLLCVLALGLMTAAGLPVVPPVFRRLARIARVGRSDPSIETRLNDLGLRSLVEGVSAMTVCWFLLAASLWAVLQSLAAEPVPFVAQFHLCLASVSLAMVAGFLSLIPGGAGVREMVLAQLVGGAFGHAVAVAAAVVLRLVWLAAELMISAVLWCIRRSGDDTPGEN